jgi:hypothetical protein
MLKKIIKAVDNFIGKKFWIRLFLFLIAIVVVIKICGVKHISDTMALGAMGFVAALIKLKDISK